MSYLNDVYFSRINHMGDDTASRIRNSGIRSFDKWMRESPHTVKNLSVERGLYFPGILLTSKDKEESKIMFLHVANRIPLVVGDIMIWPQEDGSEERWILFQEEKMTNQIHKTFRIIRCNYLLKWVDAMGHVQQSWSYVVSSVDSKIKGNFRTWNNLITPQPNKYAEIIMPRRQIDRSTNFIIEEESWQVVEYDHTSVPGIIYLSLTENKINLVYDDVENNIADTDKIARYTISAAEEVQQFVVGEPIKPTFTLMRNGIPCTLPTTITSNNLSVAKMVGEELMAVGTGTAELVVSLTDYPDQFVLINIEVANEASTDNYVYIEGPEKLRLTQKGTYTVKSKNGLADNVTVTFSASPLITILSTSGATCQVEANWKNELGEATLIAMCTSQTETHEYTKTIQIKPLW